MKESTFQGNASEGNGGAIVNENQLSITDCEFTANTAKDDGGAIFNSKEAEINAYDTSISTKYVNIVNTPFNKNKAAKGGAIHTPCVIMYDPEKLDPYDIPIAKQKNGIGFKNCELNNNEPDDISVKHRTERKYY